MQCRPSSSTPSTSTTVTVEPDSVIPDYFINRAGKTIVDAANEGLRQQVLRGAACNQAE
jgi:hypothetical protein